MKRKTLQRGGLSLPGVASVPGLGDIAQQVKDTAKAAVTTAIAENPVTAQIAGVTETMKGVVQKVTDAPELIKGVVQQTVAEQLGQPLTGNTGEFAAEGEYPAAEEEYPMPEAADAETWFGGGARRKSRRTCYRALATPVYVTYIRKNVLIKRPKSRRRKPSRKSSKRHSRRRRS
jgi:hypothetical protein